MDQKRQHLLGVGVLLVVAAAIGWHFYVQRTSAPTSGDFLPYYGPPTGLEQTLAQENPDVSQVLPSAPNAATARDAWRARSRVYNTAAAPLDGG